MYYTPTIISVIKIIRVGLAEHVARIGEVHTGFWCANVKGRDHL
jgi:hypothetical protein